MIEIFGEEYYIDLEELESFLIIDLDSNNDVTTKTVISYGEDGEMVGRDVVTDEHIKHKEINGVKFDIVRGFIADLGDGSEGMVDYDSALASRNLDKMGVRFKLAFNTLLYYDILKKLD